MSKEYLIAINELYQILDLLPEEERKRIPVKFIKFIKSEDKGVLGCNIDPYIPLEEQALSEGTKQLLAFIYKKYFSE